MQRVEATVLHSENANSSTERVSQLSVLQDKEGSSCTPVPPLMGPLPKVRLTPFIRPFTYVGVDYMGSFEVKVGRSLVKRSLALQFRITALNLWVLVVCCQKRCRRSRQSTRIVQQHSPTRERSGTSMYPLLLTRGDHGRES